MKCIFKYTNLVLDTQDCKDIDSNVCQSLRHSGHVDRCQDQEFANVFCPKTCQNCCMYKLFTIFAWLKRENSFDTYFVCLFFVMICYTLLWNLITEWNNKKWNTTVLYIYRYVRALKQLVMCTIMWTHFSVFCYNCFVHSKSQQQIDLCYYNLTVCQSNHQVCKLLTYYII